MDERFQPQRLISFGVLLFILVGVLYSHLTQKEETEQTQSHDGVSVSAVSVVEKEFQKEPVILIGQEEDEEVYFPRDPKELKKEIEKLLAEAPKKKGKGQLRVSVCAIG